MNYLGWRTAVPGGDLDGRTLLVGQPREFEVGSLGTHKGTSSVHHHIAPSTAIASPVSQPQLTQPTAPFWSLQPHISIPQVPSQHGTQASFIRIQPTWLGVQHTHNLYISYRRSEGADRDLELVGDGAFAGKVRAVVWSGRLG